MTSSHPQWHAIEVTNVVECLTTSDSSGLSNEEAVNRLRLHGKNELPKAQAEHFLIRFLRQMHAPLVYVLIVAALVSGILGEITDASVILGVVLVNALIGFIQEGKALASLEALSNSVQGLATVLRGGARHRIAISDVVPGDIVIIESGDRIAADIRLTWVKDLAVAEASLTGESVPVDKDTSSLPPETVLADRLNMVYATTVATRGGGRGVVVATGMDTEIGNISSLVSSAEPLSTPLTKHIERFSNQLMFAVLALAVITFLVGIARGNSAFDMLMASVALSVGAIPEGLPAAVTIILAIGVSRMSKRGAIIRKLPAVETLGSTSVICSDKTGTLTENRMTVIYVETMGGEYDIGATEFKPHSEIVDAGLLETIRAGVLCSTATIQEVDGRFEAIGDPTEAALVVLGRKSSMSRESEHQRLPLLDVLPFSSEAQYMATLHADGSGSRIYIKGSIESISTRCSHMLNANGELEDYDDGRIQERVGILSSRGWRVLACAIGKHESQVQALDHTDVENGLTFCGLVAMIDPPRIEAQQAIAECVKAGIRVKMITGDHSATAATIASQLGIQGAMEDGVLASRTGAQLASMTPEEFDVAADDVAVFARVSPEQKLRLVEALQRMGNVVAMTGDGVNDAPALITANIGVAMGRSGTDVAKDASEMVLTDDNFATIVAAVEEGRTVFANLVKFIVWTIPINLGEGLVVVAAVAAGADLPILPVQILWINMTTAVILGLTLAFEPIETNAMDMPPRNQTDPLFTRDLFMRTLFVGVLLLVASFGIYLMELALDSSIALARTAAANVFVILGVFYLFNCRTLVGPSRTTAFSNMYIWYGSALMIALQILFTYLPFFNNTFHTEALPLRTWAVISACGVVLLLSVGLEKRVRTWFG